MSTELQESQTQKTDTAVESNDTNPFSAADEKSNEQASENKEAVKSEGEPSESFLGKIDDKTDEKLDVSDAEKVDEGKPEESDKPIVYDLKLPENAQVDDTVLAEVKEFAEANKLSPEAAQDVVERVNRAAEGALQKAVDNWEKGAEEQRQSLLSDPELGGDNLKETDILATSALKRFDPTGELQQMLSDGKNQYNPVVVGFLKRIGKEISPDTLHLGGSRTGGELTQQEKDDQMFPADKL